MEVDKKKTRTDEAWVRLYARFETDVYKRQLVDEYWNEDFWRNDNIIEPTESLENAVSKLRKQSN